MKLADWLKANDMTAAAFASQIGVKRAAVSRWLQGIRTPSNANTFQKIAEATGGQVTPNDFFAAPAQQPDSEAA